MYKLRAKIFLGMIGLVFLGAAGRLFHLQIFQGQEFRREYEQSLQRTELLPAQRGRIMDRAGRILAVDYPCHDLCLEYAFMIGEKRWGRRQERAIAKELGVPTAQAAEIYRQRARETWRLTEQAAAKAGATLYDTPSESGTVDRILRRVQYLRRRVGMTVQEERWAHVVVPGLDGQQALELRSQLDQTVGMVIRPSHSRSYPCGPTACHIIGLTGQVSEAEQQEYNLALEDADWLKMMRENYLDGDTIGKAGIEKACQNVLRGRRGYRRFRASGGEQEESEEPVRGEDVHLTVDIDLQMELADLFRRMRTEQIQGVTDPHGRCTNGSIVVLSVPSAEVLAMVSLPTFDLNRYRRDYAQLRDDQRDTPLMHRAVAACYPPGSTVKPIAALAGLGGGYITTATKFHCSGYLFPDVHDRFRCWIARQGGAHGDLSIVEALQHSCNVFFYHVGERLGVQEMRNWFIQFGFGEVPGTGLPAERPGLLPTRGPKGLARMLAIGQGPIAVTPLHLAAAQVTLARGGKFVSPLLALEGGPPRIRRDFPVTRADGDAVREGMYRVVNDRRGTAYKIFHGPGVEPLGFDVCGKTGTAQTQPLRLDSNHSGRIDAGDETVYSGDTAWFVGFAPYQDPQVAVVVLVEYGGGGGLHAGPIAREAFRICKRRGYIR